MVTVGGRGDYDDRYYLGGGCRITLPGSPVERFVDRSARTRRCSHRNRAGAGSGLTPLGARSGHERGMVRRRRGLASAPLCPAERPASPLLRLTEVVSVEAEGLFDWRPRCAAWHTTPTLRVLTDPD